MIGQQNDKFAVAGNPKCVETDSVISVQSSLQSSPFVVNPVVFTLKALHK